jgi:hypothetical protein
MEANPHRAMKVVVGYVHADAAPTNPGWPARFRAWFRT